MTDPSNAPEDTEMRATFTAWMPCPRPEMVTPVLMPGGRVVCASVPPESGADVWAFMAGRGPDYFFGGDAP